MSHWKTIADIRREYGNLSLSETQADDCPLRQFERWFAEVAITEKSDPTAMVLSTVDKKGQADSRVVLLKETKNGAFVFYTNYQSTKALQIEANAHVALNFYWPEMARQIRIRGLAQKISQERSDEYFLSRPRMSQLSAIASAQSHEIANRDVLEKALNELIARYQQEPIVRPEQWGGYEVVPHEIEFWQGRDNRLHDRILYQLKQGQWLHHRLAP